MISRIQLEQLSRQYKTNTTVIAREYIQLVFLQNYYELSGSENTFFKGDTAIRFLMGGFRFSEDLDFTCENTPRDTKKLVEDTLIKVQAVISNIKLRKRKTVVGKSYLLTTNKELVGFPIFVRLDFSFREKVWQKRKDIIKSSFPVIFSSFVHFIGEEEIIAEKIRALLSRSKGRDIFDLWFLLSQGHQLRPSIISQKMDYYPKIAFNWEKVLKKIKRYDYASFKGDILPFISIDKRVKIKETFAIVKKELSLIINRQIEKG